ncbi:SdrD B-like domain-containing protein [Aequorivita capsosiphonis]|uniref:SdrD B-like domain-containing protein n=1 Tax=Aequorivita capsosiphonis TaxID=487317 RepID=UPI001FE05145|nr:SdrD B-like domain-containing protein [Aequorivita capsosiphonis]
MLFGLFNAYAQNENQLGFYFEKDTLSVEQGQSFINFLVLKNLSESEIIVENIAPQEKYPGLLLSSQSTYTLAKDEKKRLPIKFLVNTDFMKMKSQEISYQLSYLIQGEKKSLEASFFVDRNEEKHIALYSFSRETYINPAQAESTISLFVENRGYSQRSIKLTFQTVPDGLEVKPKEITLSLEGQEKRLVEFRVSLRHQGDFYPDYNISVRATDLINNEQVGNTNLKLIILSNNRQVMRGPGLEMGKNFVEVGYNEQSSGFNYLQLKGNTEFLIGKDMQGRFNLATDYYFSENQYNLYDTWFELERKNSLLRLGNVYANDYDYSVSGRGGLIKTKIGENKAVEVFALDNNYNLYGTYFPENKGSKIAGAKFSFGETNEFNGKLSYIFDHNPRLETDTQVANFVSSFVGGAIHNFRVEAGASHEKGSVNDDQNTGISAGLNYETRFGKWEFQSLNDIASKSYAGLNRGSFNFNQNIGYKISKFGRLFLQYQNSQVQPEYLSLQQTGDYGGQDYYPYYFYSTQSLKTGTQFSLAKWSFTLSPQIERQKSINTSFAQELLSYRFRTNIGTSFNGHGLDISAEYSYSRPSNLLWFHSLKTTLSYRYLGFSLNASAQINPNDVIDLNYYNMEAKNFFNYNAYASYNFQTINNILTGAISAGINYSELYSNTNKTLNGNIEYKFSQSWAATGYGNYSEYNSTMNFGFSGSNYQFKVGIKKYFIKATAAGNHKVSLQLYHDKNFNGVYDSDEVVIADETVKLNDFVAITDKNGKVRFSNVPDGTYTIKINETAGLRMITDASIIVNQNKTLKIGLVKKNMVIGKLVEIKQAYDKLDTYVRGVVIYAKDNEGTISSTVVDQNNEFEFFLGNGTYDIYIENSKYEYINPSQKIVVESADYARPLIFKYRKKDTEIKVKKF